MSESILSQPFFHNEADAYEFVEGRLWPHGPVCPKCGEIGRAGKLQGASTRVGTWKCYGCRKPFTVKVGTIFESSHIALRLWLQAIFLISSSKKGISSNQLHRTLGITLKSAWFMSHRIREAMRENGFDVFGSGGGDVEVDETYIGHDKTIKPKGEKKGRGFHHKNKILSLVDRKSGKARSFVVDDVKASTLIPIMQANISREARILTDEAGQYKHVDQHFAGHDFTRHSAGEYVSKADRTIHTNTIEGYFSVFKRGMKGVYQHCGHNHLHRYMAEYEEMVLQGVKGKRLTCAATA